MACFLEERKVFDGGGGGGVTNSGLFYPMMISGRRGGCQILNYIPYPSSPTLLNGTALTKNLNK